MRYRSDPKSTRLAKDKRKMDDVLSPTKWLTIPEAAALAGVPVETVLESIMAGRIQAYYFAPETTTIH